MVPDPPVIGDAACIVIEGADARSFAQVQLSANVSALAPGHWQWNAWLDPKGRARALMHLVDAGNGALVAILRGGNAESVRTELARYLLRSRTTLASRRLTGRAGGALACGTSRSDPDGTLILGYGSRSLHLTAGTAAPDAAAQMAWRLEDIRQGWPVLPDAEPRFLPPALGLERLGAVAFDKGCFPGQEIALRLHLRGGHKHRLCHLRGVASPTGDEIQLASGSRCPVLDAVTIDGTTDALAVGPLEFPAEATDGDRGWRLVSQFDA